MTPPCGQNFFKNCLKLFPQFSRLNCFSISSQAQISDSALKTFDAVEKDQVYQS